MNIKIMARGIGYLLIAGGLLGAAIALSNRPNLTAETLRPEPSATAALGAELSHCQTMSPEAAADGACKAVWEANRRRFLESGKLSRDRVTYRVRETPDVDEPASPLARELPASAPQSPSTPNFNAPQPPGDIAGHPQ